MGSRNKWRAPTAATLPEPTQLRIDTEATDAASAEEQGPVTEQAADLVTEQLAAEPEAQAPAARPGHVRCLVTSPLSCNGVLYAEGDVAEFPEHIASTCPALAPST